jgi:hypothetical protein
VLEVRGDGAPGDEQLLGDLAIREACGNEAHDLDLGRRQAVPSEGWAPWCARRWGDTQCAERREGTVDIPCRLEELVQACRFLEEGQRLFDSGRAPQCDRGVFACCGELVGARAESVGGHRFEEDIGISEELTPATQGKASGRR